MSSASLIPTSPPQFRATRQSSTLPAMQVTGLKSWIHTVSTQSSRRIPDVRALFNHNPDHVLGRTTSGTLQLSIDARGLAYVVNPPDTQLANDLITSMRRKDITGSSFGFCVTRDQWTDNADGTLSGRILEVSTLLDVSPVTYPAYDSATSQVRSILNRCRQSFALGSSSAANQPS